jgi:heat shock protein HtpX
MNNVKTFVLMAGLMALFLVAGQAIGGQQGLIMAFAMGSAMNFLMYFFSDKMVLKMYRARVITREDAPQLYDMVDRLRQRAGLPMPVVAVADQDQPNAFATGRSPSSPRCRSTRWKRSLRTSWPTSRTATCSFPPSRRESRAPSATCPTC